MEIDFTFEALSDARQRELGQKYLLPNGENAALYRNCAFDVAEELADVVNICKLWVAKGGEGYLWAANIEGLIKVASTWGEFMLSIAKNGEDEIEVNRVLPVVLRGAKDD